jgi:hypothetical protein
MQALRLKAKLLRKLIPVFASGASFAGAAASMDELLQMELNDVGPVMLAIAEALEPAELSQLIGECLKATSIEADHAGKLKRIELNTENKIDLHVPDVTTLYKILFFALKVNFGDFIEGALEFVSQVMAKKSKESAAAKDRRSSSTETLPTSG